MKKGAIHFVIPILVGAITLAVIAFSANKNNTQKPLPENLRELVKNTPTSTPFPFEELTIPYLRNRKFESKLAELTKYATNAGYTSYLTSYDSDGLKVNGLLTIPTSEEPDGGFPAIVFVHGYIVPSAYTSTGRYNDYIDYLARSGFVVFKIDLRGHGESEGEPGGAYYSPDYVVDTLNAYSALQNSEFVNPEAIGLWGHSMAGNVVFRSMVVNKNIPAVVIWAGAVYTYEDMQQFSIDDNSYRPPPQDSEVQKKRQLLRETYGNFDAGHEFWQKIVPTNYLDGVTGSLQIHHSTDDNVVDVGYSRNLMSILDETSIEHELFEYTTGGHNLTGVSFNTAMRRSVEFYKNKLK